MIYNTYTFSLKPKENNELLYPRKFGNTKIGNFKPYFNIGLFLVTPVEEWFDQESFKDHVHENSKRIIEWYQAVD